MILFYDLYIYLKSTCVIHCDMIYNMNKLIFIADIEVVRKKCHFLKYFKVQTVTELEKNILF